MSAQTETWPRPHRLSIGDYCRMAEVGVLSSDDRTELIDGEIVDMPPIGSEHASVVTLLSRRLIRAVDDSVEVRIQSPIRFMPRSELQPDFALVKRTTDAYRGAHPVATDVLLLIEVSDSTLQYDLEAKARLYATQGIPEYWVIDLMNGRVVRHRAPSGQKYTQLDEITAGTLPIPSSAAALNVRDLF
ncbi:MAG TPA: Uma2 family endonuclease [Vicinamibacterales bacterium]|nr:Uma2 family endonuclease [Vicinamibacterales bacterium]